MKTRRVILLTGLGFAVASFVLTVSLVAKNTTSDPAQTGPYAVGHTSLMLSDPSRPCDVGARPIPVDIFYPVDPATATPAAPQAVYMLDPLNHFMPTLSSDWEAVGIDRALEAPPASLAKPFPLVVFSPGYGAPIWAHFYQGARLASHGFVVAIMYHYGDNALGEQYAHFAIACHNRPMDVSFVLSDLLARSTAPEGLLSGLIDPAKVAASGWSLGGFAAMALAAGADNIGKTVEPMLYPEEFPVPPECFIPIPADPRIKAIVPLDGSNQLLEFHELARVTVPAMGIGEAWATLRSWGDPWVSWQARQHAAFQGHPSYRVDVAGAYHVSFSDMWLAMQVLYNIGVIPDEASLQAAQEYYAAPTPNALVLQRSTKYMIAFLKTIFSGEQEYKNILTPGYVLKNEPLLQFFVTEKKNPNSIDEQWPNWPDYFIYFTSQPGSQQAKAEKNPQTALGIPYVGLK